MKRPYFLLGIVMVVMLAYFLLATPEMNDDGFQYEGFAESLARGKLDFKSFYGFQGLSFLAVPVFWLTGSSNSIILVSIILSLLSIPLAFLVGRIYYHILNQNKLAMDQANQAGWYFLALFLLMPFPYTTMFRGFQEAALLFFIFLILYGSFRDKNWTSLAWSVGGITKPFALTLFPLFFKNFLHRRKIIWVSLALVIGAAYLGVSYNQTGHLVNNAAINSYQNNFDIGNPPPLIKSFTVGLKGFLRVGANLLLSFRKIMISPLIIVLGALSLLFNKNLKLRKEIILTILLHFLLVGSLTFSFSKYLLPMTTLFALVSVSYLLKYPWLWSIVLFDSFFVFKPIFNFFGHTYWSSFYIYLLPLCLSAVILVLSTAFHGREKR